MKKFLSFILLLFLFFTHSKSFTKNLPFSLSVPPHFSISIFAQDMPKVRVMAISSTNNIYALSSLGTLYKINSNGIKTVLLTGLTQSIGIALYGKDLIVSSRTTLYSIKNIESITKPLAIKDLTVLYNKLPNNPWHGGRYIAVQGDLLYVNIGIPCNICKPNNPIFGNIIVFNLKDTPIKNYSFVAKDIRNSVGFDTDPITGKLYFSNNEQDTLGDDFPQDEINKVEFQGESFGYPYYSNSKPNSGFTPPVNYKLSPAFFLLGGHVAPLGIHFYRGQSFPLSYHNSLFVAEHGSWARSEKSGYKVGVLLLDSKTRSIIGFKDFITGFKKNEKTLGRPVDIKEDNLGNIYVTDDFNGFIYKISYKE